MTFMGRLLPLTAISNSNIPTPCCLFWPPSPFRCVATTLGSGSQSWCSWKKILLYHVIFQEDQMLQPTHNMDLQTAVSPVPQGDRRVQPVWASGWELFGFTTQWENQLEAVGRSTSGNTSTPALFTTSMEPKAVPWSVAHPNQSR